MNWSDKKRKENVNKENKKVVDINKGKVVYSTADPEAKVSGIPSMSFQRNQYEKDIFKAAADKLGLSVNAYLRQSGLEKAAKLGIY